MKKDIDKKNNIDKDFGSIDSLDSKNKNNIESGEYVYDEDMSMIYDEVEKREAQKKSANKNNSMESSKKEHEDNDGKEDNSFSNADIPEDKTKIQYMKKNIKIISASVVLALLLGTTGYLSYQISSDKILKNTYVSGVYVGNMTKSEAVEKLKSSKELSDIVIKYGDKTWSTPVSDLNVKMDYQKMVDDAYSYNRSNGFVSNLIATLKGDFGSKKFISATMSYDKETLKSKVETIKKELDSKVKNATLSADENGNVTVVKEEAGREVDVDKNTSLIAKNMSMGKLKTTLDVKLEEPSIKSDLFKGIDTILSSYSTTFGGLSGRDYNIIKSTNESGGIILKPGEEYSFNGITGEKTIANGYRTAPVIESGKLVAGIGGGVCQTSSTIFNAALLSGMEITERRSHTIPSDYVKIGRDATVFDGNPGQDLKFKNPYKHNVYIKNFISGNKVVSQIFGSKEDVQNIDIVTSLLSSYGAGNKVINDPSLPAGKKVVSEYSRPGYKAVTYRIFKDKQGNKIKTETIGYSNYPAKAGVVRVGSAKAPATKPQKATPGATQGTAVKPQATTQTQQ